MPTTILLAPQICIPSYDPAAAYCLLLPRLTTRKATQLQGRRNMGGRGGLQILVAIEAKHSPSKEKGLLLAPPPPGFSDLPTALQLYNERQACAQCIAM